MAVILNTNPFNHQEKKYYCCCLHSRRAIYVFAGWLLYQFVYDVFFTFSMEMNDTMRILYFAYLLLEIITFIGLFLAFWKKNEFFIIPAIIYLITAIATSAKEIIIGLCALLYPDSGVPEIYGEQFRQAETNDTWFFHGARIHQHDVPFYAILSLAVVPFILLIHISFMVIAIKFYLYYRDWRIARKNPQQRGRTYEIRTETTDDHPEPLKFQQPMSTTPVRMP